MNFIVQYYAYITKNNIIILTHNIFNENKKNMITLLYQLYKLF